MKRVLFDHCVPRPFRNLLVDCDVSTALDVGWEQLKNGELIDAAEGAGFEVLITADKNLQYQQNLATRRTANIKLPTNRLLLISNYAPQVNAALTTIAAGNYVAIEF
jgi:hypothetical protein